MQSPLTTFLVVLFNNILWTSSVDGDGSVFCNVVRADNFFNENCKTLIESLHQYVTLFINKWKMDEVILMQSGTYLPAASASQAVAPDQ